MSADERRHPVRIAIRTAQLLRAAFAATLVFARESLRPGSRREAALRAVGRALVHLCNDLGATFLKVGQIASTRADLLPRPVVDELASLRDRVPAFAFEAVRDTIESDLGRPLEEMFLEFEREPVAAASVAQVHRAVLRETGECVAVKVRRPDILERARLDRSILIAAARFLERIVPSLRLVSLEEAIRNFCDAVEAQIHLSNELLHNERFTRNFSDDPDLHFPRPVPALCSDGVLTMEFIEGLREEDLHRGAVDVERLVKAGMRGVCRMIFLHGFVHADLHPGNLRFLPPGRIVFLDLGLVGEIDDADRITTARLLYAFATGDGPTAARLFYDNAPHRATRDYAAYEAEIQAFLSEVQRKGLGHLQIALEIGRLFDILRRHRIQARSHMTMVNLALMTAEGLGKRLAPELSLIDEALPYLTEALAGANRAVAGGG